MLWGVLQAEHYALVADEGHKRAVRYKPGMSGYMRD